TNAVQELYQDLLGRPADSTGLNSFVGFLGNGGTLEKVKEAIFGSPEYFQQRGQGTNSGFLTALYNDILGRGVDPAGAAAFGTELAQGRAHSLAASEILTSTEGLRDYVAGLYTQFLHRTADEAGLTSWVNALKAGTTDAQVLAGIVGSPEYFNQN